MRIAASTSFAAAAVAIWMNASHTVLVSGLATDALIGGILCDGILPEAFCDLNDAILGSIVGSGTADEGPVSTPQVVDTVVKQPTIAPSVAPLTVAPVTVAPVTVAPRIEEEEEEEEEEANAIGKKDKKDKEDKEKVDKEDKEKVDKEDKEIENMGNSQSEEIETDTEEAVERQSVINLATRPSMQSPTSPPTPVPSSAAPITAKPTSVPTDAPTDVPTDSPTSTSTSATTRDSAADEPFTSEESIVGGSTVSPTMVDTVDMTMVDTQDVTEVDDVSAQVPSTPASETKLSLVAPDTDIEATPSSTPTEDPTALQTIDYFEMETNSTNSTNSTAGFIAGLAVLDGNEEDFGDFGEGLNGDDKRKSGGKNKAAKVSKDKTSSAKFGQGRKLSSTPATRRRVMHIRGLSSS